MKKNRRLPDFVIIGAMKAGTSSLFNYLQAHPALCGSTPKEPGFFSDKKWRGDLKPYLRVFPDNDLMKFEASTNYTKFPTFSNVPERLRAVVPDAKLIYIVRHPVDRIVSQLHHMLAYPQFAADFSPDSQVFWNTRGRQSIEVSSYAMQIRQYLKYYDRSSIHTLRLEDLVQNPSVELNRILSFLGLDDTYYDGQTSFSTYNSSDAKTRVRNRFLYRILKSAHKHHVLPPLHHFLQAPLPRPQLSPERRRWLWDQVRDDMREYEEIMGIHLGYSSPQ